MQELIAKEFGSETKNEQMNYKIDTKGVIIFTLKSGGTIRDTGTELHFSSHDDSAQKLAPKYAKMKWGRKFEIENSTIKISKNIQARENVR